MQTEKFQILNPSKTKYILFSELKKKYDNNDSTKFTEQELKSLLSMLYAFEIHFEEAKKLTTKEQKEFLFDKNPYFKISIDFGLILLDNLEGFKKECFQELLSNPYNFNNIFKSEELNIFNQDVLISQMNIRQWEYGKHFFNCFYEKIDLQTTYWETYKNKIISYTQYKSNFWNIMYQKMSQIKTHLENHEAILLAFLIKSKIENQELNMKDYLFLGFIGSQKMNYIYSREQALKNSLQEILSLNPNLKKGIGGPKRW